MKIYLYDEKRRYTTNVEIPEDSVQPPLSTTVPVPDGKKNYYWNGTEWIEKQEDTDKKLSYSEILKPLPTPQDKMVSQLALQQAQNKVEQDKLNSQLALQIATLTAKGVQSHA